MRQENKLYSLILALILLIPSSCLFAQEEPAVTAGFEFRPIIPSGLFRTGPISGTITTLTGGLPEVTKFIVSQEFSYDLGMVINGRIYRNLGFETGICYTTRNYSLEIKDGSFDGTSSFKIVGYEVPLAALVSIPISTVTRFNNSLGVVVDVFPSDEETSGDNYSQYALRYHEFNMALTANSGFKFTTTKDGAFYIGGSYHLLFADIYKMRLIYIPNPNSATAPTPTLYTDLIGNYITIDLKYFFFNNAPQKK